MLSVFVFFSVSIPLTATKNILGIVFKKKLNNYSNNNPLFKKINQLADEKFQMESFKTKLVRLDVKHKLLSFIKNSVFFIKKKTL